MLALASVCNFCNLCIQLLADGRQPKLRRVGRTSAVSHFIMCLQSHGLQGGPKKVFRVYGTCREGLLVDSTRFTMCCQQKPQSDRQWMPCSNKQIRHVQLLQHQTAMPRNCATSGRRAFPPTALAFQHPQTRLLKSFMAFSMSLISSTTVLSSFWCRTNKWK